MSIRVSNPGHSLVAHILDSAVEAGWLAVDGRHIARLRRDEGGRGALSITAKQSLKTQAYMINSGFLELVNLWFDLVSKTELSMIPDICNWILACSVGIVNLFQLNRISFSMQSNIHKF